MKGYKKYPLVEIIWEDHEGSASWLDGDKEDETVMECRTVGWLTHTSKKHYFIYNSLTNDGGRGGVTKILRKVVIKKTVLREKF